MFRALSRVTSGGRFIPQVDGLRFVAIVAVILYHLNDYLVHKRGWLESANVVQSGLFGVLSVGNSGVQLFFTISGFILGLPFLDSIHKSRGFDLRKYFLRRVTRLEPPYIVNLLVATLLLWVVQRQPLHQLITPLAASMGYVHNLTYGELSAINGVAWSLEVEVQFYLLAPILAWLIYRQPLLLRRLTLGALIVLAVAVKFLSSEGYPPRVALSLLGHYEFFIAGLLLADIYYHDWRSAPARTILHDVAGAAAWTCMIAVLWSNSTRPLLVIPTLAACYCTFRGQFHGMVLGHPVLTVIGGMCYTIYLYHFYVISAVGRAALGPLASLNYSAQLLAFAALTIPAILLVSGILFLLIEKPCMSWRPFDKRDRSEKPSSAPLESPHRVNVSVAASQTASFGNRH